MIISRESLKLQWQRRSFSSILEEKKPVSFCRCHQHDTGECQQSTLRTDNVFGHSYKCFSLDAFYWSLQYKIKFKTLHSLLDRYFSMCDRMKTHNNKIFMWGRWVNPSTLGSLIVLNWFPLCLNEGQLGSIFLQIHNIIMCAWQLLD